MLPLDSHFADCLDDCLTTDAIIVAMTVATTVATSVSIVVSTVLILHHSGKGIFMTTPKLVFFFAPMGSDLRWLSYGTILTL